MIKQAQRTAMMRDPAMAAATLTGAQADAMKAAASNSAGAMTGFMGMGMAANAGGLNAQQLFEMGQKQQAQQQSVQQQAAQPVSPAGNGAGAAAAAGSWTCSCGAVSSGKFCPECGASRPVEDSWTCSCGTVNKEVLYELRSEEAGEEDAVSLQQVRMGTGRSGESTEILPECGDPFGPEDAV